MFRNTVALVLRVGSETIKKCLFIHIHIYIYMCVCVCVCVCVSVWGEGVEGGGTVSSTVHIHPYATRFVKF